MSKLLINEQPLQVLPTLAEKIGLNEAIFIQQVHYFLNISQNYVEGSFWVYNTMEDWQSIFPFWSFKTVQRIIKNLEEKGLILSTNKFNKMKMDKTKWYTIDYKKLDELTGQNDQISSGQKGISNWSNCPNRTGQNDQISSGQNDQSNNHKNKDYYTQDNNPSPLKSSNDNLGELANANVQPVKKSKQSKSEIVIDYQVVAQTYNDCVIEMNRPLPKIANPEALSDKRKRAIKKIASALKKRFGNCSVDAFRDYFMDFLKSARPFYFGENDRGWVASFDYLLREETLDKTVEGGL